MKAALRRAGAVLASQLLVLLLIALCAALAALAGLIARPINLAIGAERLGSPISTSGVYGREQHPDGYAYRWTSGSATMALRWAFAHAPAYVAELRLRADNPSGPQPLSFAAGGSDLALATPESRFRTYRLLIGPPESGDELWLNLRTTPFVAPGNPRPLGVILTSAELRPLPALDLAAAAVLLAGLPLLYILGRASGAGGWQALALTALAGLGPVALGAVGQPGPLSNATLSGLALAGAGGATMLTRGAHRPGTAIRLALAALGLIVAFAGALWPAWLSDDAFISFRYAQNLVAGNGLVYNAGERVEGYTNFLWTMLAALVLALGGDLAVWSHLAGVALGLAIVLLTYTQAARLLPAPWALVAALACGTSQSLLLYTARGSGLETGLFALLLLLAGMAYLAARGRQRYLAGTGVLLALAALTRPEGVLVAGLSGLHLLATSWQGGQGEGKKGGVRGIPAYSFGAFAWPQLLALGLAFLAIFLPYFLWRLSYYGDLLPNTFYAKTGGGLRQVLRGLAYAGGFALTLGGPLLLAIGLPWLGGWRAALVSWRGYLLPLAGLYSAYIVAVGGDHFRGERFFVPILPWLAILLADGLAAAHAAIAGRANGGNGRRTIAPAVVNLLLALGLLGGSLAALARTDGEAETIRGLDESVWIWREIGWWVADNGPPEASLAASGAGAIAFYSQRTTVDLLGLTDRHIGRLPVEDMGAGVAGHEKRDPAYVLDERRPTYIPQIWDDYFGGPPALRERYSLQPIRTRSGRELLLWVRE